MSDLQAVFRWHEPPGKDKTIVPIVPPFDSGPRYLSSMEILAGGSGIVRLPFQLHGRDVRGYHTICGQNTQVMMRCSACQFAVTSFSPAEALQLLWDHHQEAPNHSGPPTGELVELMPADPFTRQVYR